MSKIDKKPLLYNTNTSYLEKEINDKFANNPDYNINQIVIFAKISQYSYYPIECTIDDTNQIRIKNAIDYTGFNLYIGSKKQFLHKQFIFNQDTYKIELDDSFKTAWNPDRFIIFQDGYLMNHGLFSYIIPSFDNTYLKKYIYSTAKLKKNTRIDIFYIEAGDNFTPVPTSRDVYLGSTKHIARKNNERTIPIPYPFKNKHSYFLVFDSEGKCLNNEEDYFISNDKFFISLKTPLALATVDYITFVFPMISKEKEEVEINNVSIIPDDDESNETGYCFDIYESSSINNSNINYNPSFLAYDLSKEDFLLFDNSTFINPSKYQIINNSSLRLINTTSSSKYTMIIPFNNDAQRQYKSDYIKPNFKVVETTITEKTNVLELPIMPVEYENMMIFKNNLILSIHDEERYIIDDINQKVIILNEEDYIPTNTTITFIFMSSNTNTDQKLMLIQENFPCTSYTMSLPDTMYRYTGQRFNKNKVLLFLDGAFIMPARYRLTNNTIYLLDDNIDFNDNHTYTIISLDAVNSEDYGVEKNVIDRTYEDDLDTITIETAHAKPI